MILGLLIIVILLVAIFFSKQLKEHNNQNLNILILGIAGGDHPGAQLTDTMILAGINTRNKEITLISSPRDLYLTQLKGKINTAYALGGFDLTKNIIMKITGLEVDYVVKIDFTGFQKLIDSVGGLDIDIENSFQDPGYPIASRDNDLCGKTQDQAQKLATISANLWEIFPCRYDILSFEKGTTHMDGATALKFARSRNAQGEEGTDFARSRRQQKVILALKEKLNLLNLISFYTIASKNIETDIDLSLTDDLIELAHEMKNAKIRNVVIDYGNKEKGTPGLLIHPSVEKYGSWVLIPRAGEENFSEIKEFIKCEVEEENCQIKD